MIQFHMEVLWRLQLCGFANPHHYSCNPDSNVSNNMKLLIEKVCYCSKTILKRTTKNNDKKILFGSRSSQIEILNKLNQTCKLVNTYCCYTVTMWTNVIIAGEGLPLYSRERLHKARWTFLKSSLHNS